MGWTCPNCKGDVSTAFCPECGECPLHARDLTLHGLMRQLLQACTSLDGPLLRSFRRLIAQPGALTLAYLEGRRKPYALPLPLFLVANVVFFGMQSLTGAKIFSTPLAEHMQSDIWGAAARRLVWSHLELRQTSLGYYAPVFDQAVAVNAKSLIVLMVLPFAGLAALVFYRNRRPFVTHVVFSLHFYAFLLLLFSASLAVVEIDQLFGGRGLHSQSMDQVMSVIQLAVCAAYLFLAAGVVYGSRGAARVFQAAPLAAAAAAIFLAYRFSVFLITMYGT